jgi:hypothetical protein
VKCEIIQISRISLKNNKISKYNPGEKSELATLEK